MSVEHDAFVALRRDAPLPPEALQPVQGEQRELTIVGIAEFAAVEEEGADALLGDDEGNALIPEGGDVMIYGDGGAGKTTLAVDLACHLAAGDDWLGIPVSRPLRVLVIENEGPRPQFRAKLGRKVEGWPGSEFATRVHVLEDPWSTLTLDDAAWRQVLAAEIAESEIDVVVVGPVTRAGMNEAGTLQEVRDFMALIGDVRHRSGRPVVFVLVHHENKGGKVSGAWEGSGDTLIHVQRQGHGRTRVFIQKARWSSTHHDTTLHLAWADNDGFELTDSPERDDDTIAAEILEFAKQTPEPAGRRSSGGSRARLTASATFAVGYSTTDGFGTAAPRLGCGSGMGKTPLPLRSFLTPRKNSEPLRRLRARAAR